MSRICTIYKCGKHKGRPCCTDCTEKDCEERCKNHPDRCKVWDEPKQKKMGRASLYDKAQIVALYEEGYARVEIAEKVGCSLNTVSAALADSEYKGKKGRVTD